MKLALVALLAICAVAVAEERSKRQVNYQFPGPRQGHAQDDAAQYQQQAPRRQYQAQPAPQAYAAAPRAAPQPRVQSYGAAPQQAAPRRPAAASRTRYADSQQDVEEDPEEDKGPSRLQLLKEESKFNCPSGKDGYYADNTVACQLFHYCVGGAKHTWTCPEGTIFHQVHLNCVADNQDASLCGQADKFYFVNDYLHRELDTRGPNNTIQYAQRYYPEGYTIGDTFVPPSAGRQQYAEDQYQQAPPQQARPQPAQYRPQAPQPQQYAPAARSNYGSAPPQRYAPQAAPPQRYVPQAAAPPPRTAAPQSYGYQQDSGVSDIDELPTLPQIPQQQPRRPAPSRAQPYGGAYQVSGARQVRYDDDRGY